MPTGYVLETGAIVDPRDVSPDADGVLRHKGGVAVAYAPHGPRSRGVEAFDEVEDRELRPEPKPKPAPRRGYKTR